MRERDISYLNWLSLVTLTARHVTCHTMSWKHVSGIYYFRRPFRYFFLQKEIILRERDGDKLVLTYHHDGIKWRRTFERATAESLKPTIC